MKSGNGFLKGCLYFWGGLILLGLLAEYAVPLAICSLISIGAYVLYRRRGNNRSVEDQIELLKARIRQADKDIQQLIELKKANVSKKVNTLLTLVILIGNSLTVVYMLLQS